jgi:hypothetical protein
MNKPGRIVVRTRQKGIEHDGNYCRCGDAQ